MTHWVSDDAKLAIGGLIVRLWRRARALLLEAARGPDRRARPRP